jgi:hypothetical protein
MPGGQVQYDVFISYKSDYKPWVETLARNLKRQRFEVWLDDWRRMPGDLIAGTLDEAINNSKAGVLVVTPEAAASGWVQEEYATMLAREKRGGFRLIPIILRESSGIPFLSNRFWVDFTKQDDYPRKLYELVQALRGSQADPDGKLDGKIDPPPSLPDIAAIGHDRQSRLFDSVFHELDDMGIMLLFMQEGMGAGTSDMLITQAAELFDRPNVYHIVPIICGDDERESYFSEIGRQLGLSGRTHSAPALAQRLPKLLNNTKTILLVLTNFENGPSDCSRDFCHVLKSFWEQKRDRIRLIFRGGEKLAALKYEQGSLSMLGIAGARLCPELTAADLVLNFKERAGGRALGHEEANAILAATGGEPRLVGNCLRRRAAASDSASTDYEQLVRDSDLASQWFLPLMRREADKMMMCRLLKRDDLGVFTSPYFNDPIMRQLFWRNALSVREVGGRHRVHWRCQALRDIGRKLFECDA